MDITPLIKTVFGEYQAHVFSMLALLAKMQYNVNKTIAVQEVKLTNVVDDVKQNTKRIDRHSTKIHDLDSEVKELKLKDKWKYGKEESG